MNLSAFETFFEERRPFFVEGASAFEFGPSFTDNRFFYSRRIGRAPSLSAAGTAAFVDEPSATSARLASRTAPRPSRRRPAARRSAASMRPWSSPASAARAALASVSTKRRAAPESVSFLVTSIVALLYSAT